MVLEPKSQLFWVESSFISQFQQRGWREEAALTGSCCPLMGREMLHSLTRNVARHPPAGVDIACCFFPLVLPRGCYTKINILSKVLLQIAPCNSWYLHYVPFWYNLAEICSPKSTMFFLIIVFLLGKKQGSYLWCCVNLFIPAGIIMGTKRLNMLCQSRCEE